MVRRLGALVGTALLVGGLLAVAGTAGTGALGGTPAPAAFRLADSSVGCNYLASGSIACRAQGESSALVLDSDGDSRVADVPVYWDDSTPVLKSSASWWNGSFSCRVEEGRAVCATEAGGTIAVGSDAYGALAPPAFVERSG